MSLFVFENKSVGFGETSTAGNKTQIKVYLFFSSRNFEHSVESPDLILPFVSMAKQQC